MTINETTACSSGFEIPKAQPETVNRRIDNTMPKEKNKRQKLVDKTLQRKLQREPK